MVKLSNPVHFLAFGFGSGLSPKAPGTMGTLAAIPVYLLLATFMSLQVYLISVILCSIAGIWICGKASESFNGSDYPGIVWDEFCGYWITMSAVPVTWYWVLLGFCLFRLFDIWKPWPVSWADKTLKGGLGIMFDDVLAGLYALCIIHIIITFMG